MLSEHLMIYILSLLDPKSQYNASMVNSKWNELVKLTQKYMGLLPTIQKIPLLSHVGLDVLRFKLLTGGMTNATYRVQIGQNISKLLTKIPGVDPLTVARHKPQRWVLRIPGEVSSFSVIRRDEAYNAQQASDLGLNVPIAYFNPGDGLQLTQFIEGVRPLDKDALQRVDILETLAGLAKKLHNSKPFLNDTAVFTRNEGLLDALKVKKFTFPAKIDFIEEQMSHIKKLFSAYKIELRPCHNDSTPLNYMRSREGEGGIEKFHQIDWEYSSNNDFLWDLVYFSIEAKLSKEQELTYLSAYFGKDKLTESVLAWFTAYKPVVEWWITLWSWTQLANEAKSVDKQAYVSLGLERYEKTMLHLQSEEFMSALAIIDADRLIPSFVGLRPF